MARYTCDYCEFETDDRMAYARHMRDNHRERRKKNEAETETEESEIEQGQEYKEEPVYKAATPRGIIKELISTAYLHLTQVQQAEILDWVDDYEGLIPPTEFEKLLSNFKGISLDMAKRTTDHYIMKLMKLAPRMPLSDIQRLELPISLNHDRSGGMAYTPEDFSVAMEGAIERLLHKSKLLQNPDILTKPAEKILMNVADTTGIVSRFMNLFFIGLEGQIRDNPYIIGDASKILPKIPKLLNLGLEEEGQKQKESEGVSRTDQAIDLYKSEVKATPKPTEAPKRVSLTELDALFSKKDEEIKEKDEEEE